MFDKKNDSVEVQDRQLEIMQARLQLFGNPLVCLLPDVKASFKIKKPQKYNINYSLMDMLELNNKYGSPYSINFTPNGDYGRLNAIWKQVTHRAQDSSGNIYCLFRDLDQKIAPSYRDKSKEDYLNYIISRIEDLGLNMHIQYITESGWGYHLFWFINPADVSAVSEVIWKDMSLIQREVCNYFEWADTQCVWQERLIRMPLSVHRKSWVPFVTRLFEVKRIRQNDWNYKVDLVQVVHENQITLEWKTQFGPNEAETLLANLKYSKQKETPTYKKLEKNPIKFQINHIPFPVIFESLQEYPRNLDGHKIRYALNWTSVIIETDGIKYITHWYKWWKRENILKNFSFEHTPNERPGGHVLKFLEQYFNYDYGAMAQFLKEKFDIELFIEWWECISKLSANKTTILFKETWVYIISPTSDSEELLFSSPFIIKWVIFVPTIIDGKQTSIMKIVLTKIEAFDDEDLEWGNDIIIDLESKVVKFNDKYLKYWLTCCWTDKKLLSFYNVVRANVRNNNIIKFDGRWDNWYYQDWYVLWQKLYSKNWNEINPDEYNIVLNTPDLQFCNDWIDCTMSEYANALMKLFSPRESLLAFCTFIAASMTYKFWKQNLVNNWQPFMLPHLFLSWKTKTGKSTLIGLLKNWFWLAEQSNKKWMTNTTVLPMKRLSATPWWLHLEEYTWDVGNKAENIVRLWINGTEWGMGKADWTYETFEFKCSYIIDGERLPSSPSLINRFVWIIMQRSDMTWDIKMLRFCSRLRYFKDFISKLYCIDQTTVAEAYEQAQDWLLENGVQDRNTSIYSYLVCVARWFDICDDEILLKAILENLQMLELGWTDVSTLWDLLSKRFAQHPRPTITQEDDDWIRYINITFTEDLFNSMRWNISSARAEFGRKRIDVNGYNLIIVINNNDSSGINQKFLTIIRPYIPQCQMTYEDIWNDSGSANE